MIFKGGAMSLSNARRFVEKMREDNSFRNRILESKGTEDLSSILEQEGLAFDQRELVGAMAECMDQLDSCACC
jgi:predicted ribosomally synthesized peptide with nif11-like leader